MQDGPAGGWASGNLNSRRAGEPGGIGDFLNSRTKSHDQGWLTALVAASVFQSVSAANYQRIIATRNSVLNEGRQIFPSKDLQFLPSEQELTLEVERKGRLIESCFASAKTGRDLDLG
jgi:hypothetical protein